MITYQGVLFFTSRQTSGLALSEWLWRQDSRQNV